MSTITFENKTITSNGNKTEISINDSDQTLTTSEYNAVTPIATTKYSDSSLREYGSTRNIDISGNSQENYAGRGVTCEYSLKVVGSPEMFTGEAQQKADKTLSNLIGLVLQTGDDRNTSPDSVLSGIDPKHLVLSMASSFASVYTPQIEPIRNLMDIPVAIGKQIAWAQQLSIANGAEQAARAAAHEVDRQKRMLESNIEAKKKELGDMFNPDSATSGSAATDLKQGNYNLSRQEVHKAHLHQIDERLAAEREIG